MEWIFVWRSSQSSLLTFYSFTSKARDFRGVYTDGRGNPISRISFLLPTTPIYRFHYMPFCVQPRIELLPIFSGVNLECFAKYYEQKTFYRKKKRGGERDMCDCILRIKYNIGQSVLLLMRVQKYRYIYSLLYLIGNATPLVCSKSTRS